VTKSNETGKRQLLQYIQSKPV